MARPAPTPGSRSTGGSGQLRHLSGGLFDGARVCLIVLAVVGSVLAVAPAAAAQGQRFPDVPADHYAFEAVEWAAEVGVTTGYTDGTFKPERPLSRRHAVVFMERYYDEILGAEESEDFTRGDMMVLLKAINDGTLRGSEASDGSAPGATGAAQGQRFPDVTADHYAFEAVEWAAEVGVTTGYTDGTFKPERPLSRRHAVVFMERYYDEILQSRRVGRLHPGRHDGGAQSHQRRHHPTHRHLHRHRRHRHRHRRHRLRRHRHRHL